MNLLSRIANRAYRTLYWPPCRAYMRYIVGDKPADSIMRTLYCIHFFKVHGYWPDLKRPQSFEEKLACRMLFERNPLWTSLTDKLRVREYVEEIVGAGCLIPLLWHGDNPEEIPFDELPCEYVIKTNHGCAMNIIVRDSVALDRSRAKKQLKEWLSTNFCERSILGTSWGYKHIKPRIMIESYLEENGNVPTDYKFFCFSGRVEYLQMNFDRYGDPFEKTFDRDFNALDVWQGTKQYPGPFKRPDNYDEMIRIAEALAQGIDFVRVDLYTVNGKVYFGEMTCYPGGGLIEWIPRKYDYLLGEKWKMNLKEKIYRCSVDHKGIESCERRD